MVPSIARSITQWVRQETGLLLEFDSITPGGAILCRDDRQRQVAIVCYGSSLTPIVRSVIRERIRGRGFSWLCNGQAARNAIELYRWGEDHRYLCSAEEAAEQLTDTYNGDGWRGLLQGNGLRLPAHLDRSRVVAVGAVDQATCPTATSAQSQARADAP